MKLKHVKSQPLLEPPAAEESDWSKITAKDRRLMAAALENARKNGNPSGLGRTLIWLKEAGIPATLTEQDKATLRNGLESARKPEGTGHVNAPELMRAHETLNQLGIQEKLTRADRKLLTSYLKEERNATDSFRGERILRVHKLLRDFGVRTEITKEDEAAVDAFMKRFREKDDPNDGLYLAQMHHQARALKIPLEITDRDRLRFKEQIAKFRRESWAKALAEVYFFLQQFGEVSGVPTDDLRWLRHDLDGDRRNNYGSEIAAMHGLLARLDLGTGRFEDGGQPLPQLKKWGERR